MEYVLLPGSSAESLQACRYVPIIDLVSEAHTLIDWLRERVFFEGLARNDRYAESRLGFKAPNIFVMTLVA